MFSVWALAIVGLAFPYRCSGQATSTVTCTTDEWTFNKDNLSPCRVASALLAACNGSTWIVNPLGPNQMYTGDGSNKCICSTVPYCLLSACAACQGDRFITWSEWSQSCTASDITISQFPIPVVISIPIWAYLDVTISNVWNSTEAQAVHNSSAAGTVGKKSNHAGAISGGVVGGVVVLSLIAIGVFLLMRRRNTTTPVPNGDKDTLDVAASQTSPHGFPSSTFPMQADWQRDPSHPSPTVFRVDDIQALLKFKHPSNEGIGAVSLTESDRRSSQLVMKQQLDQLEKQLEQLSPQKLSWSPRPMPPMPDWKHNGTIRSAPPKVDKFNIQDSRWKRSKTLGHFQGKKKWSKKQRHKHTRAHKVGLGFKYQTSAIPQTLPFGTAPQIGHTSQDGTPPQLIVQRAFKNPVPVVSEETRARPEDEGPDLFVPSSITSSNDPFSPLMPLSRNRFGKQPVEDMRV
ncbi:hypothetical protein BU17DRAFT_68439 [Hysterangium stoloniferum]|nr:hypothetical protein BU17DRAFT_68439 [Hysterangium stoloniferum]